MTPRRARVVLAVAVLAIAGCGDDDGGAEAGGSTPAPDLTVEAHDIDFDSDVDELTSGEQRVEPNRQSTNLI